MRALIIGAPISLALASIVSLATNGQSNQVVIYEGQGYHTSPTGPFGQPFQIRLLVRANGIDIVYPTLNCSGILMWQKTVGEVSEYREQINLGRDGCVDNGTVRIQARAGTADWYWSGEGTQYPNVTASAHLRSMTPTSVPATFTPFQQPSSPPQPLSNPFSYCKAKGDTGAIENAPKVVVDAVAEGGLAEVFWRCKNREVYGCYGGASGRACQKWSPSRSPTESLRKFCAENPSSSVPNVVNDTPYSWKCKGTTPVLDARYSRPSLDNGYYAEAWKKVSPR